MGGPRARLPSHEGERRRLDGAQHHEQARLLQQLQDRLLVRGGPREAHGRVLCVPRDLRADLCRRPVHARAVFRQLCFLLGRAWRLPALGEGRAAEDGPDGLRALYEDDRQVLRPRPRHAARRRDPSSVTPSSTSTSRGPRGVETPFPWATTWASSCRA